MPRTLKPRAYIFIRQIMTQLLNIHLVNRICCFRRISDQEHINEAPYHVLKHELNKMDSFSTALEEMFESCKHNKLSDMISRKEREKEAEEMMKKNLVG